MFRGRGGCKVTVLSVLGGVLAFRILVLVLLLVMTTSSSEVVLRVMNVPRVSRRRSRVTGTFSS